MPIQAGPPISLGCGHTICKTCQATITTEPENQSSNYALLQMVSSSAAATQDHTSPPDPQSSLGVNKFHSTTPTNNNNNQIIARKDGDEEAPSSVQKLLPEDFECYKTSKTCIEDLALFIKPVSNNDSAGNLLSRQMQRKLVTLINCQLVEDEGMSRALRAARLLGERTVTELILQHQNPQQLSANLWAAVRARGCQFLGPAMQEEVLKLVLLALEDGSALSRKVLVMFVVQRLEPHFPQASKTSIGHVVQLLYRASCFKVSKREGDSSLMQLKEEFRTYEALRREHDAQIVQIATEAGLRIAPDQWSSLLYGDTAHKSHMQSINDKLQTPESFSQSVQELVLALQRTGDPANLSTLQPSLKCLADIDPNAENSVPSWKEVAEALIAVKKAVVGLVEFVQHHGNKKLQVKHWFALSMSETYFKRYFLYLQEMSHLNPPPKYKINMCRTLIQRGNCPRGIKCSFAHSEKELMQGKSRQMNNSSTRNLTGKDDFYLSEQYGNVQPPNFMQSAETSPMRFPNPTCNGASTSSSSNVSNSMNLPKAASLNSNSLLVPQQYHNDLILPVPTHSQHLQQHSPHHGPSPTIFPNQNPIHPPFHPSQYANNAMPSQVSPMGKFGYDQAKFGNNMRVSPVVAPHPQVSGQQRNFPNHQVVPIPMKNNFNQNNYHPTQNPPPPPPPPPGKFLPGDLYSNNINGPNNKMVNMPFNMRQHEAEFSNKQDPFLNVPQSQQPMQQPAFYWQQKSSPNHHPPLIKSPSHGPMNSAMHQQSSQSNVQGKAGQFNFPPNKMQQNSPRNEMMAVPPIRHPPVKSVNSFPGKEDMAYWNMQHHISGQQTQHSAIPVPIMPPTNNQTQVRGGGNSGNMLGQPHGLPQMYPIPSSSQQTLAKHTFDRSDSILAGEDTPYDVTTTTSKYGPISRKSSNTIGADALRGSTQVSSLNVDMRQQAWARSQSNNNLSNNAPISILQPKFADDFVGDSCYDKMMSSTSSKDGKSAKGQMLVSSWFFQ